MPKEIGGIFKKNDEVWEILKYDNLEDSYICHNLSAHNYQSKKFREEEMEDK